MPDHAFEHDLCLVVQRLNRRLSRGANQALKNASLTIEQVTLMSVLGGRPSMRAAELCEKLELGASTVSMNVRPLIKRGLIVSQDIARQSG
ncbi:MarR family winged helix-turn-helix transcriptional regulator [Agrobacterium salinitolerans]